MIVFEKKKKSGNTAGSRGKKEVRYNFKGANQFQNGVKCFICDKKFNLGNKRHHW